MPTKESKMDRIKKLHQAQAIERKDISLKDLVAQEGKDGALTIKIKGFASKWVEKYASEDNKGYHTMVYLADGRKTGAFANSLYDLASFFYKGAGLNVGELFNKIDFKDGYIEVKVTTIELDKKKSTYNFEILDGEIGKCDLIGSTKDNDTLLLEGEVQ